jgi:hypothetical protein
MISWLAEDLLASLKGLWSMELLSSLDKTIIHTESNIMPKACSTGFTPNVDWLAGWQTDRQTDRQTDTHTHTLASRYSIDAVHWKQHIPSVADEWKQELLWENLLPSPNRTNQQLVIVNENCYVGAIGSNVGTCTNRIITNCQHFQHFLWDSLPVRSDVKRTPASFTHECWRNVKCPKGKRLLSTVLRESYSASFRNNSTNRAAVLASLTVYARKSGEWTFKCPSPSLITIYHEFSIQF